jgi:hypothetical protein
MRRAKRIDGPMPVLPMSNQSADADNRVVDVLGELVAHRDANFVIALAVRKVSAAKPLISGTVSRSQTMTLLIWPIRGY